MSQRCVWLKNKAQKHEKTKKNMDDGWDSLTHEYEQQLTRSDDEDGVGSDTEDMLMSSIFFNQKVQGQQLGTDGSEDKAKQQRKADQREVQPEKKSKKRKSRRDSDDDEDDSFKSFTPIRKAKARYYIEFSVTCFHCGKSGHVSKDCTETRHKELPCYLCGQFGHKKEGCPQEICFNCGLAGHRIKSCKKPPKKMSTPCSACGRLGHLAEHCMIYWRKYNVERDDSKPIPPHKLKLSCYNCGGTGHFGDICKQDRMDSFPFPPISSFRLDDINRVPAAYILNQKTTTTPIKNPKQKSGQFKNAVQPQANKSTSKPNSDKPPSADKSSPVQKPKIHRTKASKRNQSIFDDHQEQQPPKKKKKTPQ